MPEGRRVTSAPRPPAVRRTEVDGVPVVWLPVKGPFAAQLTFRVGQADETLPLRGISHMVEHLALHQAGQVPHWHNGATASTTTSFMVSGTRDEVVAHLGDVCAALADLATDRLDTERTVLASEAAQAGGAAARSLTAMRWGPRGFGLPGYRELGVPAMTPRQVRAWSRRHFTSGNAVLALTGMPPASLRLPLPQPVKAPPLPVSVPVVPIPGRYTYSQKGVGLSYLSRRNAAGLAAAWALSKKLQDYVRHELGIAYGVTGSMDRITPDLAHTLLWIDSLPQNARAVQDAVTKVLRTFPQEPLTETELARYQASTLESMAGEGAAARQLMTAAAHVLMGTQAPTRAQLQAHVRKLTVSSVAAEAGAAMKSLLIAAPAVNAVPGDLARVVPSWSSERVEGPSLAPSAAATDKRATALVVAPDGVSMVAGDEGAITVRFRECAAMVCYDDGARSLVGTDGFELFLKPEEWQDFAAARTVIDAAVNLDRVVPGGPRTAPPAPAAPATTPPALQAPVGRGADSRPVLRRLLSRRWVVAVLWTPLVLAFGLILFFNHSVSGTAISGAFAGMVGVNIARARRIRKRKTRRKP